MFDSLKIIDTDAHWSEPYDLWLSHAPAKYAESVPRVAEDQNGDMAWIFEGKRILPLELGGHMIDQAGFKMPDTMASGAEQEFNEDFLPLDLVHPASHDPGARLELLDRQQIWAQILYPNVLLFATGHLVHCENRSLANAVMTIYNDCAAEFQMAGQERLFPQAVLPFWDIPASVEEASRVKALGFRGVVLPGEPQRGGLPDPSDSSWNPLYEALSDLELPINIHIGASVISDVHSEAARQPGHVRWQSSVAANPRARRAGASMGSVTNQAFLTNLLVSDLPLRYPKLRWVSVESGIGWIPYMLESIDFLYREVYEGYPEYPGPSVPSAAEMFRRSTYACFWFERSGPTDLLGTIGVDNVMWESDFPHNTCLYPNPVERTAENIGSLPFQTVKKIMQDNAAELYRIAV